MKLFDFHEYHGGLEKWPKLSRKEHAAYWRWHAETLAQHPNWLRPSRETAEQVWQRAHPFLAESAVKKILGRSRWGQHVDVAIKQAMVVTLDTFLGYAESRKIISTARLVEALASKWSARYLTIKAETGCRRIQEMTRLDVKSIVRELQCEGIDFSVFWKIAVGAPAFVKKSIPLYHRGWEPIPHRGYALFPRRKGIAKEFVKIVSADQTYDRPHAPRVSGLLFADQAIPRAPTRRKFAGGRAYNVVESGKPARARLRALERVVLLFDVLNFRTDYRAYRGMLRRSLRDEWNKQERGRIGGMKAQAQTVRRQVHALKSDALIDGRYVKIRSGYFRAINRRYHARHFSPEWVSAKELPGGIGAPRERWFRFERPEAWNDLPRPLPDWVVRHFPDLVHHLELTEDERRTHQAQQWKTYPLRGYDTASSMTQILTWLCGITELEPLVYNPEKSFTTYLAELFYTERDRLRLRGAYTNPDDIRDMVKTLWTAHIYGGRLDRAVARDARWITDPNAQPPARPGRRATPAKWRQYRKARAAFSRTHVRPTVTAIESVLNEQSWYAPLRIFYEAARYIAHVAQERNRFRGVTLVDPYDGETIRWNPTRIGTYRLTGTGWELQLRLPGEWQDGNEIDPKTGKPLPAFADSERDTAGDDYLVDGRALRRALPPYLIHTLDAALSSLVMEQFDPRTIRPTSRAELAAQYPPRHYGPEDGVQLLPSQPLAFIALHDAWYAPGHHSPAPPILGEFSVELTVPVAVRAAAQEWDHRLGGIYDSLVEYLAGTPYEAWAFGIRARWQTRPDAPRFVISPTPKRV